MSKLSDAAAFGSPASSYPVTVVRGTGGGALTTERARFTNTG
jgi:hypothetical protein